MYFSVNELLQFINFSKCSLIIGDAYMLCSNNHKNKRNAKIYKLSNQFNESKSTLFGTL